MATIVNAAGKSFGHNRQEGDGLGANPLILNFRGNALAQLGRFDEAVEDYVEATQIFDADGEARRWVGRIWAPHGWC